MLACQIGEDGDRDGIPNTLAEAMACGLPVVATRLPGIEEVVRDGVTGILVPPQDPAALACALVQILDHPERARAIGAKAREWVAEHPTLSYWLEKEQENWDEVGVDFTIRTSG